MVEEKKTETKKENIDQKGKDVKGKKKTEKEKEEELSEEDLRKKEELDLLVERAQDKESGVQKLALNTLTTEIKSATSSMTSVPKPLKFRRPHYDKRKECFSTGPRGENKILLSDILSILAMTMAKPGSRESLNYKFQGSLENIGSWGHEYVKHIAGEIAQEYDQRLKDEKDIEDLNRLIDQIIPFDMAHNAEHEACDLLMEVEQIDKITKYVDESNFSRVGLYLSSCANYVTEPDDIQILKVTLDVYRKFKQYPDALRTALKIDMSDTKTAKAIYDTS